MKIEDFQSGVYVDQYQYKSFSPAKVNLEWVWENPLINTQLEHATKALAELNAFSQIVPDIDLFIHMHVLKEASQSSRIEGTQTHMDEALMDQSQIDPEKRDDWQEVHNYVEAMNRALGELESLPLSVRLLKHTHAILMQGVRGERKSPGSFRVSQNWIGGSNLQNAVFIPPHHQELAELMGDLEQFWHNEAVQVPDLIRIAISHYQFETIHPFLDGNGRMGRLLITLCLVSRGLLDKPSLYLSDFLEQHRGSYYDALTSVRASNDLLHWVHLFLTAVIETAEKGKQTFQQILALRDEMDGRVVTLGRRAENGRLLLMHLYQQPLVSIGDVAELLGVTYRSAGGLVDKFVELGILEKGAGRLRNRSFVFGRYLALFR